MPSTNLVDRQRADRGGEYDRLVHTSSKPAGCDPDEPSGGRCNRLRASCSSRPDDLFATGVRFPWCGNPSPGMSQAAADLIPERPTLATLRKAASRCRACPLWETGSRTVFGEGAARAKAMFVGEQPGDQEDRQGRPFVGPAGRVLDEALELAGIARDSIYLTNAVKHFKWEKRGKRRIHAKPSWSEQMACRPWLEAELVVLRPHVLVCLGATAAQSLLGKQFRVTKERGRWLDSDLADLVVATIHPSAILRQRDGASRRRELQLFVEDLRLVAAELDTKGQTREAGPEPGSS